MSCEQNDGWGPWNVQQERLRDMEDQAVFDNEGNIVYPNGKWPWTCTVSGLIAGDFEPTQQRGWQPKEKKSGRI